MPKNIAFNFHYVASKTHQAPTPADFVRLVDSQAELIGLEPGNPGHILAIRFFLYHARGNRTILQIAIQEVLEHAFSHVKTFPEIFEAARTKYATTKYAALANDKQGCEFVE